MVLSRRGAVAWSFKWIGVLSAFASVGMVSAAPVGSDAVIPVRQVALRDVADALPFDGVVEAKRQAVVSSLVAGRILELKVEAGQSVAKGQVLARVDARESAEAVAAAQAQVTVARTQYERTEKLVTQKFLSAAALDKARADRDAANAQLAAAQAGNSHGTITAPMSGVVAVKSAEAGDLATPGKPLLTIYEPGALRVIVQVPQRQLQAMRGSKRVRVEFPELGQTMELSSFDVLPTLDPATHTAEVRLTLPANKSLQPGLAARVQFLGGESKRLTVPMQALVRRGDVAAVYVQGQRGGQAVWILRQLRLGDRQGNGEVEVLAGLAGGETLALDPVAAGVAARRSASVAVR